MALDEKLWLFSYKMKSESAKLLAEKLNIWMLKHEGSTFKGKKGQYILNWGAGTGVYHPARTGQATVLNPPHLIDIAVNKRAFFDLVTEDGGPRVPEWTTQERKAKYWLDAGYEVVARTQVEGAKGAGIVVMKSLIDFVHASLYTMKVANVAEYRVYMFQDEVLDVRIKRGRPDKDGMMIGDGVEFIQMNDFLRETPADVLVQAKKAAKKLPLTTQGLDVIWDGKSAWVLESNSAPYLGIQIAKKYAVALKDFVEEKKAA